MWLSCSVHAAGRLTLPAGLHCMCRVTPCVYLSNLADAPRPLWSRPSHTARPALLLASDFTFAGRFSLLHNKEKNPPKRSVIYNILFLRPWSPLNPFTLLCFLLINTPRWVGRYVSLFLLKLCPLATPAGYNENNHVHPSIDPFSKPASSCAQGPGGSAGASQLS